MPVSSPGPGVALVPINSLSSRGAQESADELYAEWERLEAIVAEGAGPD